jgi:Rho-binding antiterminator
MNEPHDPARGYRPISCATYSGYETAILHRRRLRLRWTDDNIIHEEIVTPIDLNTLEHEEFLICRTQQEQEVRVRLDRILRMEAP